MSGSKKFRLFFLRGRSGRRLVCARAGDRAGEAGYQTSLVVLSASEPLVDTKVEPRVYARQLDEIESSPPR